MTFFRALLRPTPLAWIGALVIALAWWGLAIAYVRGSL